MGKRQEHNIRKSMPGGKFPNHFIIFSGAVIGKPDGAAKGIFIVVG